MSKTIKFLIVVALFVGFASCSDDDDPTPLVEVKSESIVNLHAPVEGGSQQGAPTFSGEFTKFDFATGKTTTSETEWDIAFRGLSIIVNGGTSAGTTDEPIRTKEAAVYIASGTIASVTEANLSMFKQDSETGYAIPEGSGNGWYTYAGDPTHLINPTPGKILVVKTRTGNYAKMEILSYYKDAPAEPDAFTDESPYFTFNYVYQPNDGVTTF
ncbi:HmuY family protein [Aureibaculum sp. A20]|uniref:HmuY family protein n=1 Tax=Aureibaculum flavum TaxID=2795986 RepID=A0ABS0WVT1_9FLAO|nr:HmuY family protein [Aureibaculum flavum]MBJ2176116.1 HmuY family protein [Aureibaculum flavum]